MSRKTSTYARKRLAKSPLMLNKTYAKEFGKASFLSVIRMHRPDNDETQVPGDCLVSDTVEASARTAMLHAHSALDGLLNCQPPVDPRLDFSRLKHVLSVSSIRTLQMIYGNRRRDFTNNIVRSELTAEQLHVVDLLTAAHKAINRAYDRWEAGRGYGLDGEGRLLLTEAIELYETILTHSTPEQMAHAHEQVLLCRSKPMGEGVAA